MPRRRRQHPFFLIAFLFLALPGSARAQSAGVEAARAFRQAQGAAILRDYAGLLALPNVASDAAGIRRNAEAIRDALARRGVTAELWELPRSPGVPGDPGMPPGDPAVPPVVFGELRVPGARRTLGLYLHYDGQPVDPAKWKTPPWQPTLLTAAREQGGVERPLPGPNEANPANPAIDPEWRLYARSASDDKAPLAALLAALDGLTARRVPLTSNFKFFFEGEEEAGSPHLRAFMEAHRDRLAVDAWLICDGPVHTSRRPQLVFGVRGVTGLEVTVYGAVRPLHSGHYGNWAPNPSMLLARLLASMKDDAGKVLVEGFYDGTVPASEAERRAMAALPDPDAALKRELGLAATEGGEGGGASLMERLLLPSLNVRGIEAGNVGDKAQNVIPSQATASLDLRLAKGNDPARLLDLVEAHIRKQGYFIVHEEPDLATRLAHPRIARVTRDEGGYPATRTSMDLPIARQVAAAADAAAGEPPLLVPTLGGSLPLYLFTDLLARPAVVVPIVNHDNNQHAPDENLRLANLWYGIDLMGALLTMP